MSLGGTPTRLGLGAFSPTTIRDGYSCDDEMFLGHSVEVDIALAGEVENAKIVG